MVLEEVNTNDNQVIDLEHKVHVKRLFVPHQPKVTSALSLF
jgi:hypothetical protein